MNRLPEAVEPLKRELGGAENNAERIAAISNLPRLFVRASDKKLAASVVEQALADYLAQPDSGCRRLDRPSAACGWKRPTLPARMDAAQRGQALDGAADGPAMLALALMDPKGRRQRRSLSENTWPEKPVSRSAWTTRAPAQCSQRYAEAATQLAQVTTDNPEYAQAWLIQGMLEMQDSKSHAAATESLQRFVQLETAKPAAATTSEESRRSLTQAYLMLAEMAEKAKDLPKAREWLDRISNSEDMIGVQVRRAGLLARQGQLSEGRALLQALPERNAAEIRAKTSAEVQFLRENKQYQSAYDVLNEALAANPQDLDFVYDKAMMAEKLGRLDEMERLLRQAIAAKPDYHHAYNALGYSLADRNVRLPEARALILKALEFAPGDPFISDSLGWVEFRSGNVLEALRILRQAYKDKPDAEIAAHLGEVLWTVGERTQAMVIWKEGLALNAENETLLETLKRLRVRL